MDSVGEESTQPQLVEMFQLYRVPIALAGMSILLIILSVFLITKQYQSNTPIEFSGSGGTATASAQASFTIDIAGGVKAPGVYKLSAGSRVEDAIIAAGGLSPDADADLIAKAINRAAILSDGAKLYIPKRGDTTAVSIGSGGSRDFSPSITSGISVNSASQAQLEALSGIGPATATKIINGRPYMSLEELVSRKILFQSTYDKLKDQLTL